jgi:alpha-tubulin suppressor-like RCC1 family protein
MSIRKNTWSLDGHYDLTKSGQNGYLGNFPLFAWGKNSIGQLGLNNITQYNSPVQIPGINWSSISSGRDHSVAFKTDGTLWTWGDNGYGQLGQNNITRYSSPVQIPGTTWSSIGSGLDSSFATKTDGTLWSWGRNYRGELGQNNLIQYSSPVQIPGNTWSSVCDGRFQVFAFKTDGTLWGWGNNYNGQLAQNNNTNYSSPVQIPGTTWSSVSVGKDNALATKTDGTLWAWGINNNGELGQGNRTGYSSPIQIPGTTWKSVGGGDGYTHSLATKTDGTLWAWGGNYFGQLGQNNRTYRSSPVQIPGTTWSSISIGTMQDYSLVTKTDGTLWAWGQNANGQLGQGNTTRYSSPVQIPGNTWISASGGDGPSFARKNE